MEAQTAGAGLSSAQAVLDGQPLVSRKGKEKVDVTDNEPQTDDVAGVLPSEGQGLLEQRTTVKCRDIHVLMDLLPRL